MLTIIQSIPIIAFILLLAGLMYLAYHGIRFNQQVLIALIAGIGFGVVLQLMPVDESMLDQLDPWLLLIGNGYLGLLKLLVVPLILTSIVQAILRLGDTKGHLLRSLAIRSVGMLLIMTAVSALIGFAIAELLQVGRGLTLDQTVLPKHQYTGLADTLLAMIPTNPISIMDNENTVAIALFAVLLGISAQWLRASDNHAVEPFARFIESFFQVVKKLTQLVIMLTPYGIFALMVHMSAHQGFSTILAIGDFLLAMYIAMGLVIVMHLALIAASGMNPLRFLKQVYPALLVAFTTRSSFASLPVSEEVLHNRLYVSQLSSSFVPSVGATVGMNACAGVFPAILAAMAMSILHIPVTTTMVISIMLVSMIASLGISGIPGTAFIAASVLLSTLGLPYAVIALVQGVDAIVDMGRTATNVHGSLTTAYLVDKSLPHQLGQE